MVRVAVLGSGNVGVATALIPALATYFGERPLELRFWDADPERADLFDRFARLCFAVARSAHEMETLPTPEEALEECGRVLVAVDDNCALKYFKGRPEAKVLDRAERAVERLLEGVSESVPVLDLVGAVSPLRLTARVVEGWPPRVEDPVLLRALPHQVLRWVRGEEYVNELLAQHERTPLKEWLDTLT